MHLLFVFLSHKAAWFVGELLMVTFAPPGTANIGSGILAMPYAFLQGGTIVSSWKLSSVACVAVVCH